MFLNICYGILLGVFIHVVNFFFKFSKDFFFCGLLSPSILLTLIRIVREFFFHSQKEFKEEHLQELKKNVYFHVGSIPQKQTDVGLEENTRTTLFILISYFLLVDILN